MPNPYVNKVVYGSSTLIDLTADTVTPAALMQGYTAHDASGAAIVGTSTSGTMVIRDSQDPHGGTVREITAGSVVTGTKAITANGTYDVAEFADASVNVPAPEPELQAKTATPTESQQTVTPDSGYDGLSSVTVGAISSTYVGSGIARRSSSDLTASGATVSVPAGYYASAASKAVASGTAGTPTATKGSVSNHSVSVTPSVTNATGYIAGGTKTGTAVTVSASELVSGSQTITENGTVDVTNLASVDVQVSSSDFVVTLTYNSTTEMYSPDKTLAEIDAAYVGGKAIVTQAFDEWGNSAPVSSSYEKPDSNMGTLYYTVYVPYADGLESGYEGHWYSLDTNGLHDDGTSYYRDTSIATAVAADVANGKTFFGASGYATGTASGGGNIVTGTFEFDSAGTKTVAIPYTGSGYPLIIDVCVTNEDTNTDWQALVSRYKVEHITMAKLHPWTVPTYGASGQNSDVFLGVARYKSSDSDATMYTSAQAQVTTLTSGFPTSSAPLRILTMPSPTSMKIMTGYASYSTPLNISYTYRIVYSE